MDPTVFYCVSLHSIASQSIPPHLTRSSKIFEDALKLRVSMFESLKLQDFAVENFEAFERLMEESRVRSKFDHYSRYYSLVSWALNEQARRLTGL